MEYTVLIYTEFFLILHVWPNTVDVNQTVEILRADSQLHCRGFIIYHLSPHKQDLTACPCCNSFAFEFIRASLTLWEWSRLLLTWTNVVKFFLNQGKRSAIIHFSRLHWSLRLFLCSLSDQCIPLMHQIVTLSINFFLSL